MSYGEFTPGEEMQGDHAGGITTVCISTHGDGKAKASEKDVGEPGLE